MRWNIYFENRQGLYQVNCNSCNDLRKFNSKDHCITSYKLAYNEFLNFERNDVISYLIRLEKRGKPKTSTLLTLTSDSTLNLSIAPLVHK